MEILDAIKYALDGDAILFLGAGFSIGGKNSRNEELPSAKRLSEIICNDLNIEYTDDLTIASERYIKDPIKGKGIDEFISMLKENLKCISVNEIQRNIIGLDWKRIYTTNYDDIIEKASYEEGKKRQTVTATIKKYDVKNINGAIIHINGYINNVSVDKFYEEFKITDESYLKSGFFDTKWKTQFEGDLRNTSAIIFIGYSLKYDLELQKILYSEKINKKCIFIDVDTLNESQKYKISTFGNLVTIGVQGFAKEIEKIKKIYIPKCSINNLQGVEQIKLNNYEEVIFGTKEVLNLLDNGFYDRKLFRSAKPYCVCRRDILKSVKKIIDDYLICILHSNFGNGKTITLEYLASEMVEDYNIYMLNDSQYIQEDIRLICEDTSKMNILFIDDYGMHLEVFKELKDEFPENLRIIATARTSINDNLLYELTEKIGYSTEFIFNYDIDKLSKNDRVGLVKLLDKYKLWGKYSRYNSNEKNNMIKKYYHNRMSNVFYMLLDSGVIEDKIKDILEVVIINETVKKFVIAQTINIICKFKLEFHQLISLANINILSLKDSCKNVKVREIYEFNEENIFFKSAILAQYIVKNGDYCDLIKDMLIEIYRNAEKQDNKKYYLLKKLLISRSNIIEIFTSKNSNIKERETRIADFYEAIMNENQVQNNPFFWLQYAITMLNLQYYSRAKVYFENAYSYAEELEAFDCFQLDTHKARFLLEYKINVDKNKENAYKDFYEAHKLLVNSNNNHIKLSYVLKQIGLYYTYYKEFYKYFNTGEIFGFNECLKVIKNKFIEYFTSIDNRSKVEYSVKISYRDYRKILKDLQPQELLDIDLLYNSKLKKGDRMRVKILSNNKGIF